MLFFFFHFVMFKNFRILPNILNLKKVELASNLQTDVAVVVKFY